MFKVGDKVQLNAVGISKGFISVKEGVTYKIRYVDKTVVGLEGINSSYYSHHFELVKENKMKLDIKTTTVAQPEVTFPCIRQGKVSGQLYLFQSMTARGISLESSTASTIWCDTDEWKGTIKITQE